MSMQDNQQIFHMVEMARRGKKGKYFNINGINESDRVMTQDGWRGY